MVSLRSICSVGETRVVSMHVNTDCGYADMQVISIGCQGCGWQSLAFCHQVLGQRERVKACLCVGAGVAHSTHNIAIPWLIQPMTLQAYDLKCSFDQLSHDPWLHARHAWRKSKLWRESEVHCAEQSMPNEHASH